MHTVFFLFFIILMNNIYGENNLKPYVEIKRYTKEQINLEFPELFTPEYIKKYNLFQFHHFPKHKDILVSIKRPIIGMNDFKDLLTLTINDTNIAYKSLIFKISETYPVFIDSTENYLPGEKIIVKFKTFDNSFDYQFCFIPFPLQCKDSEGKVLLSAELLNFDKFSERYKLRFLNFKEGEKITFESTSGNETISNQIKYTANYSQIYCPAILNEDGGFGKICITCENQKKFSLDIPWGDELFIVSE